MEAKLGVVRAALKDPFHQIQTLVDITHDNLLFTADPGNTQQAPAATAAVAAAPASESGVVSMTTQVGESAGPASGRTTFNVSLEALSFEVLEPGKGGVANLEISTVSAVGSMLASTGGLETVHLSMSALQVQDNRDSAGDGSRSSSSSSRYSLPVVYRNQLCRRLHDVREGV